MGNDREAITEFAKFVGGNLSEIDKHKVDNKLTKANQLNARSIFRAPPNPEPSNSSGNQPPPSGEQPTGEQTQTEQVVNKQQQASNVVQLLTQMVELLKSIDSKLEGSIQSQEIESQKNAETEQNR